MSIIQSYIENAGGAFLNAKNCPAGTLFTIQEVVLDEETYPKPYIVCTGFSSIDTEEEVKVRLGIRNVKSIAESLGEDETKWVGQKIQCLGHQDYPGMGKGILWGGVLRATPTAPVETVKTIMVKIRKATGMKAQEIKKLIDKEIEDSEGLLDEVSCAQIIAEKLLKKE